MAKHENRRRRKRSRPSDRRQHQDQHQSSGEDNRSQENSKTTSLYEKKSRVLLLTRGGLRDGWQDKCRHHYRGTKTFQRVIRQAVRKFDGEEFSRSIFKYIVSREELEGFSFYAGQDADYAEKIKSRRDLQDRVCELYEEELKKLRGNHDERSNRKSSRGGRKDSRERDLNSGKDETRENIDIEMGDGRRRPNDMRSHRKGKHDDPSEAILQNNKPKDRHWSGKQKTLGISSTSLKRRKAQSVGTASTDTNAAIVLSDDSFRKYVKAAVLQFDGAPYSRAVYKYMKRQTKHASIYASQEEADEDGDEATKVEVEEAVYKIYQEERYMLVSARTKDVYFDVAGHPGTSFWRNTVRLVVAENNHQTAELDCKIYKAIKNRLLGVSYYVGHPPNCKKASKRQIVEKFDDQFDFENKRLLQIQLKKINRRLQQRPPIPGNLYWRLLGQKISSWYRNWEWFHQKSGQCKRAVARQPLVIKVKTSCSPYYAKAKQTLQPCYTTTRSFFQTDPESGEDAYQRIARHLEITAFGHTSFWPLLALIGSAFVSIVFLIIFSILRRIAFSVVFPES